MTEKRIYLRYGYRGKPSQERYIEAGEYDWADPALLGLAQYLVDTTHAVEIKQPEPLALSVEAESVDTVNMELAHDAGIVDLPVIEGSEAKPKPRAKRKRSRSRSRNEEG